MTDKEIINQWKHERELAECVCSYFVDQVELSLVNETIDLINRQQAKNKELAEAIHNLTIEKDALFDKAEELKAEIERLKDCPKCVYEYDGEITEYCIQGPCTNFTTVEKIKSEAYKEFTIRLKCGVPQETGIIRCSDVDNLLKEMIGKEEK